MIYGVDYEGTRRECGNCGHNTNVHTYCHSCEMDICEGCEDDHTCEDEIPVRKPAARAMCCNCKTHVVRWNSIYCSDACRRAFLTFPEVA